MAVEEQSTTKEIQGNSTIGSLVWKFGERMTAQLVSTVVAIILARILTPNDYGIVAIVNIIITICNAFVSGGLGNSLIQKKNADELDFSSMFFFSLGLSGVLYGMVFLLAKPIAVFYNNEILVGIIRVMGLRLPFAAVNSIQQAYISRKMQFRKFFVATLFGTIVSAFVGISMAISGFGSWALVFQYLTNVIIDTTVLFFVGGWRPRLSFSLRRVKELLPFGLKVMGTTLLDTIFNEIRSVIISAKYSPQDLAMYDNGRKYPNLIVTNVNTSIGSVMFPVMSKEQDNRDRIKMTMKRSIEVSCFLVAPMLLGFMACAHRFVSVILTSKWNSCVPYIWITCVMCLFYPIHTINIQALNAIGQSGKTLRLEVIKKVLNIIILLATMQFGVVWIALGAMIVSLASTYINAMFSKEYFGYSFLNQLIDMAPSLLLSVVMAGCVFLFDCKINLNEVLMLFLDILLGIGVYLVGACVFHNKALYILIGKIKPILALVKRRSRK